MEIIEDQVQAAYLWILGRNADEAGLTGYSEQIRSGGLTAGGLRSILLDSEEFAGARPSFVVVDMVHGVKVVVDPREPEFGRHIVGGGIWEPHIVDAIRSHLSPGDTFIDIGGNVGVMSFQAADAVGATGRVIAFEPNMRNVDAFRRGIVANGFDNVLLLPLALSDHRHMIGLTAASNAKVMGDAVATQSADVVQAVAADEMLAGEARIDLVKIDIEGFELPALRGMDRALRRHRPKILCEFNPLCLRAQGGIDPRLLADHLFGLSPVAHLIEHDGSRTEVGSPDELMAIWAARDAEVSGQGILPPGWVHFDILLDMKVAS